jgi:hypothetical protein
MNQETDVLQKSRALQKRAHEVIEELRLITRWETVGKTYLVGSTRFGLMYSPNLDFEIYVDTPRIADGFAIIQQIAEIPGVKQIEYLNFLNIPSDPGLYWRIDYEDAQGVLWDVDNWLVPHSHPHAGMADRFAQAMEKALTDETRRAILQIKQGASQNPKPRGIDIYRAVLQGRARSMEEYQAWIQKNPPNFLEIEEWSPES